jgi:hypothetical protein
VNQNQTVSTFSNLLHWGVKKAIKIEEANRIQINHIIINMFSLLCNIIKFVLTNGLHYLTHYEIWLYQFQAATRKYLTTIVAVSTNSLHRGH